MPPVSTAPPPDLESLRAACKGQQLRSPGDVLRSTIDDVDCAIAAHPKTAVTAAAAAGWFIGIGKTPVRWLKDHVNTLLATAAGGTLGAFGLHVYAAHLPQALTRLASTLGVSATQVEDVATLGLVALGAHLGHRLATRAIDRRDHPQTGGSPLKRLGRGVLAYSGMALGSALGVGLAAAAGVTAGLPLAAAGAAGLLAGTLLGPFANEKGVCESWKWAAVASMIPAGAALGASGLVAFQGPLGAAIVGIDAAGATLLFPFVRKGLFYALTGIRR